MENDNPDPSHTEPGKINIFTDGSGIGGSFGSGFFIKWSDQTRVGTAAIGKYSSVFLAELSAIELSVLKFTQNETWVGRVNIFSDSLSAIQAIKAPYTNSKAVVNCWKALKLIDEVGSWSLSWVKSHNGILGNEEADKLAKQGTQLKIQGPQPSRPIPVSLIRKEISSHIQRKWREYWNNRSDCRQTKLWFPKPDKNRSKQLMALRKKDFGLVTRWLTGHC
jgi:ribonuclease HI